MKRLCLVQVLSLTMVILLVPRITVQTVSSNPVTIIVPDDYPTIQAAINAAASGDTVFVRNGTYYEHIIVDRSITLVGEDSRTTIIDGNGTGIVIKLNSFIHDVGISDFTLRNAGRNYYSIRELDSCICGYPSAYLQNINVENNFLQNAATGIVLGNHASSIYINNNTISDTSEYAIDIGGPASPTATNVTISNNFIHNHVFGIGLEGDSQYCRIINNTVENGDAGITLVPNINARVPVSNLIDGNMLSNNSHTNIWVMGALSRSQDCYTNIFRRNNLTNGQYGNNLVVWGFNLASFMQDIDSSNTANNKRIYYLTNASNIDIDPTDCPEAGYLALVNCTNLNAKDFDFTANKDGLLLAGCTNCTVMNATVKDNRVRLVLPSNESVPSDSSGLKFFESSGNTVVNSMICNNTCGVCLYHSDNNTFCHDAFIGNDLPVFSDYYYPSYYSQSHRVSSGYFSRCDWNNSVEGNYWSDYNGADSNGDGIGDTPYIIDANNTDRYPLMSPYWYWSNPAACDLNRDMKTDMRDVALAATCFGYRAGDPGWDPRADATGDGIIDIRDLVAIARHFGEHYSKDTKEDAKT